MFNCTSRKWASRKYDLAAEEAERGKLGVQLQSGSVFCDRLCCEGLDLIVLGATPSRAEMPRKSERGGYRQTRFRSEMLPAWREIANALIEPWNQKGQCAWRINENRNTVELREPPLWILFEKCQK